MTDPGRGPDPGGSASPVDVARQLREAADRMMAGWAAAAGSMTGAAVNRPARPALPPMPRLPKLPATMTTEQVQAVLDDLAAKRAQVQALRDQLEAFDEQLGALETGLRPVVEWTRAWAELERSIGQVWGTSGGSAG